MGGPLKRLADGYSLGRHLLLGVQEGGWRTRPAAGQPRRSLRQVLRPQSRRLGSNRKTRRRGFNAQGKFVGMGSIIDQLAPGFHMTEAQKLATGNDPLRTRVQRKQMAAAIDAGCSPAINERPRKSKSTVPPKPPPRSRSETLHDEMKTLSATFTDLATKLGLVLIPIVTTFAGVLLKLIPIVSSVVDFIKAHWVPLAAVLIGPIAPIIAAFTIWRGKIESIFTGVVNWIKNAWHTVETDTIGLVDKIAHFFSELPGKIIGFLSSIPGKIVGVWHKVESGGHDGDLQHRQVLLRTARQNPRRSRSPARRHAASLGEKLGEELVTGVGKFAKRSPTRSRTPSKKRLRPSEASFRWWRWRRQGREHRRRCGRYGSSRCWRERRRKGNYANGPEAGAVFRTLPLRWLGTRPRSPPLPPAMLAAACTRCRGTPPSASR